MDVADIPTQFTKDFNTAWSFAVQQGFSVELANTFAQSFAVSSMSRRFRQGQIALQSVPVPVNPSGMLKSSLIATGVLAPRPRRSKIEARAERLAKSIA